jgi:uncharacterized membrane protein
MLVLSGIAVIVAGFLLRFNPLAVTAIAALITGLAAGLDPVAVVAALGKAFNQNRYVTMVYLVLPVIGLLEAHGLQERARALVAGMRGATTARLLTLYLLARQITAALGLVSIAGHPQTVRPMLAPMAVEAAGTDDDGRVPAMAAATDNIGVFFGEDIFIALGSILLMKGVLEGYGIMLEPIRLSVWAIPTAVAAFVVHGVRLWLFGRRLR